MPKRIQKNRISPKTKEILVLLAAGAFIPASILIPGLPLALKPFIDYKKEQDYKKWKSFNQARLKQSIKRLHSQKLVNIEESAIKISEKGKVKFLNFKLENLKLQKKWDGKWRLIIYDIPKEKKKERDYLRSILKRLECYPIQKSVYLTPYKCEEEIEYLRQLFNVANAVQVLKVVSLENEKPYREYFGI